MKWKYAVITGFLGSLQDRFALYSRPRDIREKLELAASIKGCSGVELVFPPDSGDPRELRVLLDDLGLGVAAVNLNVKSEEKWRFGSFSSSVPAVRREAIDYMKRAMDHAAGLGCDLVTSAFLNDGSDYPFEIDYQSAFNWAVDGVREAASHRGDIRVALEYKASEPRAHCLVNNAGKAACMALRTGCANVGVNVDIGHAFQAQEVPADSIAFLAAIDRLFYVHVNDNYRNWDWDLVPGTVNYWDYIELLFTLRRVGYEGWLTADVFPQRHDAARVMEKTFEWMDHLAEIAGRLDEEKIAALMREKDAFAVLEYVRSRGNEEKI